MTQFDLHVATEPDFSEELEEQLLAIGLQHDKLLDRHVGFYGKVEVSACPLIGLHLTKKYSSTSTTEARQVIDQELHYVEGLLKKYGAVGYAHGEVTHDQYDTTIRKGGIFHNRVVWPVKPFVPTFSSSNKKWDIHIAIPIDQFPEQLKETLE